MSANTPLSDPSPLINHSIIRLRVSGGKDEQEKVVRVGFRRSGYRSWRERSLLRAGMRRRWIEHFYLCRISKRCDRMEVVSVWLDGYSVIIHSFLSRCLLSVPWLCHICMLLSTFCHRYGFRIHRHICFPLPRHAFGRTCEFKIVLTMESLQYRGL